MHSQEKLSEIVRLHRGVIGLLKFTGEVVEVFRDNGRWSVRPIRGWDHAGRNRKNTQ